ncbi:DUF58 domain-containing protein [Cellulomonas sp. Root137]|uniref:DUF58 domain-containing protein n=1 Tax=Cellulomonas sp. Root137 TaxID=1736459 RepID=UPI0006F25117|nr:DUF58 domain-containing protein [Cellulomonas sp. Root137]KQY47520.1 hypothetical protein ASD18_09420 [Cellulomonas sp. Root137]KRD44651.1 hypothetical protein ASE38_11285 [Cellulomonas sp. Root930]
MAVTWRAVVLAALGLPVVLLVPATGTVLLWALLVVVACAVDVALAASPREVGVRRDVPASVRLTEPSSSTLTLSHLGRRRLRGVVRDAWPPSSGAQVDRHRLDVAPGEGARVRTVLVPTRRGDAHADRVTIRTLGPLRLAGRQASLTVPGRLRVLPEFASRRHLPSRLARLRELDGRAAVQVRGPGTEFDSLREYVIGDDVRSIDWRATARRSDVVVRTWRPERDRRVLIVLDTGRTSAVRVLDAPRLDASIEAALLLAALATKAGDRVELLVFDRKVRGRVASATGARVMAQFADTLALAEPALVETDWPGVVAQVRQRLSQRALVVLLTALDPAAVEQGLLGVAGQLTERHQVVLASVSDPEVDTLRTSRDSAAAVFDAAAAERVGLERAAVAVRLRQRGAEVVDALPDDLAPRLADTYLALKAAGRL